MNTLEIIAIIYAVGVVWVAYEIYTAPLMPSDYGLTDEEKKLWKKIEESEKKESHGKLGGNLEDVHMRNSNNKGDSFEEDFENQPFGD
mgnify:CR=1 FL=1|jgi:hypothetical protein